MKKFILTFAPKPNQDDSLNVWFYPDPMPIIPDGESMQSVGFGYKKKEDGTICLTICPNCERENYALAVTTGSCSNCGYNANEAMQEQLRGKPLDEIH